MCSNPAYKTRRTRIGHFATMCIAERVEGAEVVEAVESVEVTEVLKVLVFLEVLETLVRKSNFRN